MERITIHTPHAVCLRHQDGKDFILIETPQRMHSVSLASNEYLLQEQKEEDGHLEEYMLWQLGFMETEGYTECSMKEYVFAHCTLATRLHGKPKPVQVKVRRTRFGTTPLTGGTVPV